MVEVRQEKIEDYAAVHMINDLAFGQQNEANLIDSLRNNAQPYISLIAVEEGKVVGHIFFSPVVIESNDSQNIVMGLAPMAIP